MRRRLEYLGLAAALSFGISGEHDANNLPESLKHAAHTVTRTCIDRAGGLRQLGIDTRDIDYDIEKASESTGETIQSVEAKNRQSAAPIDYGTFPQIDEFLADKETVTSTHTVPNLGTHIELTKFDNNWEFSPEHIDYVFRKTLETVEPGYNLRNVSYACLLDEIYTELRLEGITFSLILVGHGDYANMRERIMPRDETSRFVGNFNARNQRMIITHWDPKRASRTVMHEYAHLAQKALGIPAKDYVLREHFADTFDATAWQIMQDEDTWVLRLPTDAHDNQS